VNEDTLSNLQIFFEWQSPEHHYDKRTNDWYWILGIIALGAAVLAFYFDNFLFGIFILLAAFTIGFLSYRETKDVDVKVTDKGIVFHRYLFAFRSHRSFWIDTEHYRGARLLLRPSSTFMPLTSIPIADEVDLNKLREFLLEVLDEEFLEESLIHKLFDKIGL
jgi:hypothetical protein